MKDRIKAIRKHFNLTQAQFGEKIGVKGNTVTTYESGDRTPSNAVIELICREFGVDELWLVSGVGEMFHERTLSEKLASFFGKTLAADDADIYKQFSFALSTTTEEELQAIKKFASRLLESENEDLYQQGYDDGYAQAKHDILYRPNDWDDI